MGRWRVALSPRAGDEAAELSPFVVTSHQDLGYQAANTLSGSRLNTPLKDTAASITIFTEEFIGDLAAENLSQVLEYGTNLQKEFDDAGTFGDSPNGNSDFQSSDTDRIRGQRATVTRNYFRWDLPVDSYNLERIEESRGPNSILFGMGSAGGVINAATKQAVARASFVKGSLATDDYGSRRASFDFNQSVLDGRFAFRLAAVDNRSETYRTYGFSDTRRLYLAARFAVDARTTVRANYESGDIHEIPKRSGTLNDGGAVLYDYLGRPTYPSPIAANGQIGIGRLGKATRMVFIKDDDLLINYAGLNNGINYGNQIGDTRFADHSVNSAVPGALRDAGFNAVSVFLKRQFGRHTFLELAYSHQDFGFTAHQPASDASRLDADPNQFLSNRARDPHAGHLYLEGVW